MSEPCVECGAKRTDITGDFCQMCERKWHQADIADLRAVITALRAELKNKSCPRCSVDGYWYRLAQLQQPLLRGAHGQLQTAVDAWESGETMSGYLTQQWHDESRELLDRLEPRE